MRLLLALAFASACSPSAAPEGLYATPFGSGSQVRFDIYHRPLPEIPLPNDFATRFDPGSPTRRRVNASLIAATEWEKGARRIIDQLDGWGTFGVVSVGFSAPLDVLNIIRRHQGDDYDPRDDAVFLVNVTPDSPDYCERVPLDMGEGNFPLTLERQDFGLTTDTRFHNQQLVFDETDEDANHNGELDLGEDTDMDGVLDRGNFARDTDGEFQPLTFYERETNTLLMKPVLPMRPETIYAAVLTSRLVDEAGRPVRSPFPYINHAEQTPALRPLVACLPSLSLSLDEVAFTWSFTTQSTTRDYVAVRDGLYGLGPMSRLADEYPPEVSELFRLKRNLPAGENPYVFNADELFRLGADVMPALFGGKVGAGAQAIIDSYRWVDFTAVGQITVPQFFRRTRGATGQYGELGPDGEPLPPLPLYQQVFELDPLTGAAFERPEKVTFWLTVPKNRNGPAPVVILSHGYTSTKLEMVAYAGYFARMGLATLAIDCVSHGADSSNLEIELAQSVFQSHGLGDFFSALSEGRAVDLDADGTMDPGADFWTAYLLHTRDVVKQSTIDHLQLVHVLKSFDGQRRWRYDVNRDGVSDLAGDFDGDGTIDIGGPASVHVTGGSLGGIISAMLGGLEPHIDTILPVAGGAGLSDVGVRSIQGGVKEAVNWRTFGPVLATQRGPAGKLELAEWIPNLNGSARLKLADFPREPREGDTAVVHNLKTGEHRCTRVHSDPQLGSALIGAAVSADQGDGLRLDIYDGPLKPKSPEGCALPGVEPSLRFDTLGVAVTYQGRTFAAGSPLIAFTDGFGLRRNSPEMRRFSGIAQVALESADPVNFAPYYERWQLQYGTGEVVQTRALIINTIGDMNVPMATGVQIARAAGYLDLFTPDGRYGKTANRVLIDHHVLEAVERAGPYRNSRGEPVLLDADHYAAVKGVDDGFDVPRLDPPLRLVGASPRLGGYRGMMLPMSLPTGRHGFSRPDPAATWNLGGYLFGVMGRFMSTDGRELSLEACNADFSCEYFPAGPPE